MMPQLSALIKRFKIQITSVITSRKLVRTSWVFAILVCGCVGLALHLGTRKAESGRVVTVQAGRRGRPYFRFEDGKAVGVEYRGNEVAVQELRSGQAEPRAMASGDLDRDATPDLVVGYRNGGIGIVTVQRGNPDAFAPRDESVYRRLQEGYNPASLLPRAEAYQVPEPADFVQAGDFNNDNRMDVLVGTRGGHLYLLAGDGQGGLSAAEHIELPGSVTTIASGEFRAADGKPEVAVGVNGPNGAELLVYDGAAGGVRSTPLEFRLLGEATAIAFGGLDNDPFMDLAVATGSQVEIIHGWGRKQNVRLPSQMQNVDAGGSALGLDTGLFVWNRESKTELATLSDDGTVRILQRGEQNEQPFSEAELAARSRARGNQERSPAGFDIETVAGWRAGNGETWKVSRELTGSPILSDTSGQNLLSSAQISARGTGNLMVLGGSGGSFEVIKQVWESAANKDELFVQKSESVGADMQAVGLETSTAPVAVLELPAKLNGNRDLLVLEQGQAAPTIVPQVATSITVDRTDDTAAASACTGAANDCSLRGAIAFANNAANQPATINVPAGTYVLSIDGTAENGFCGNNSIGDLDLGGNNNSIVGAGAATTVIRQSTANDRVICLDPTVAGGLSYSISGVTIAGGREFDTQSVGGGGLTGGAQNDNLTLTNVSFVNNQTRTVAGPGGGGWAITGGNVTMTGCTVGAANAPGVSQTDLTLANSSAVSGGGIAFTPGDPLNRQPSAGVLTINGNGTQPITLIQKNTAASAAAGGGGADLFTHNLGTGSFHLTDVNITGNQATNGLGGGIIVESLALTLDATNTHTTSITSNTAQVNGGGLYWSGGSGTIDGSIAGSTITISGNTATNDANGAGIGDNTVGGVTAKGTLNLADNVEIQVNGLWTNFTGSNVTFANLSIVDGSFTANNSTITVNSNLNLAKNTLTGGTFNGNTGTLTVGTLNLMTGTFNASSGTTNVTTYNQNTNSFNGIAQTGATFNGGSGTVNVSGNFTFSAGTFNANTGTFVFNGSGAQSLTGAVTFNNLTVNKSGGTLTLNNSITLTGNLNVAAGTFDLGSFTANRNVNGGTLTVANGATLKIGGTNTIPSNYATHSIGATSTIEYSGTNQSVAVLNSSQNYGNLTTSGSGTKTLAGSISVVGNLTIGSGTVLAGGANTLNIAGNWINNTGNTGFTSTGAGLVNFNGGSAQSLSGTTTFNNLQLSLTGGNALTLNSGITVNGNWTNNSSATALSAGSNTVTFAGASANTLGGTFSTTFGNLTVNKAGGTLTLAIDTSITGDLTVSAGTLDLGAFTANRTAPGGTLTVSSGATLRVGGTNGLPANYTTYSFASGSAERFNGTNQNVAGGITYGSLVLEGSGIKTLQGPITVQNDLIIASGVTFDDSGNHNITIGGNWTNNGGTFIPGTSTVTFNSTTTPQSINGSAVIQNFANITINKSGQTASIAGSTTTLTLTGTLTLTAGTFDKGTANVINIGGDWINNATFTAGAGTVVFNGGVLQTIGGSTPTTFNNLTINNNSGVNLSQNETVTGLLTLTNGIVNTGANTLSLGAAATFTRTNGFVNGTLKKTFGANGAFTFPLGTPTGYSPLDVTVTFGAPADFTAKITQGPQPLLNPALTLQRYWTLTAAGLTANLVFHYVDGDVAGDESQYRIIRVSGGTSVGFPNACPGSPCVDTVNNTGTINNVTNFSDWTLGQQVAPTATNGDVAGRILDTSGNPVAGAAVRLSGTQNRLTITDALGNYHFDNVETTGFYTVTPARANYTFSPTQRSFSQLGQHTDAAFTASVNGGTVVNPLDTTEFFVRQQYLDFLNREPDEPGFTSWVNGLNNCAAGDTSCDRLHVSEMFFRSAEFQDRGYYIYRFYSAAFGRKPDYAEFKPDMAHVSGFLTTDQLETAKMQFVTDFIARPAFAVKYNGLSNAAYVDALINTAQVSLANRQTIIDALNNGAIDRAQALRIIAESSEVYAKYYNQAFVVMEYFGYLRRDPDALYADWIDVLNQTGDARHLVGGFVDSSEYRGRFPQ